MSLARLNEHAFNTQTLRGLGETHLAVVPLSSSASETVSSIANRTAVVAASAEGLLTPTAATQRAAMATLIAAGGLTQTSPNVLRLGASDESAAGSLTAVPNAIRLGVLSASVATDTMVTGNTTFKGVAVFDSVATLFATTSRVVFADLALSSSMDLTSSEATATRSATAAFTAHGDVASLVAAMGWGGVSALTTSTTLNASAVEIFGAQSLLSSQGTLFFAADFSTVFADVLAERANLLDRVVHHRFGLVVRDIRMKHQDSAGMHVSSVFVVRHLDGYVLAVGVVTTDYAPTPFIVGLSALNSGDVFNSSVAGVTVTFFDDLFQLTPDVLAEWSISLSPD